ncbi:MAG: hypothetical protein IOD12_03060 [Silvanigrellales bacterium]|jgi:hypothetical protein|nr:hypothetical protein [Silvanigrellales bacterium]
MNLATSNGVRRSLRRVCSLAKSVGVLSLCLPAFAFGITRIGNAKFGSDDLGFEATLAKPFIFLREIDDEGALLVSKGDGILRDGKTLVVKPLGAAIPDVETFTRKEFRNLFLGTVRMRSIWREVSPLQDPSACMESFVGVSGGRVWGVASWGAGKGIVFYGEDDITVETSVEAMLRSVEIGQGACAWE